MFGFGDDRDENYERSQQAYNQIDNRENEADWKHETVGAAAGFGAVKLFEDRQRKEGEPVNHEFAKECIGAFAGWEVDRLAETKGADFVDREKAKRDAAQHGRDLYDQQYGGQNDYNPNRDSPHQSLDRQFGGDYQNSSYGEDYHGDNYRNYGN